MKMRTFYAVAISIALLIIAITAIIVYYELQIHQSQPAQAVYSFTEEERDLMARVLYNEAGANSYQLKVYCASVMVNQLDAGYYGKTITEVLSRPNAYVGYRYLNRTQNVDLTECYEIVYRICQQGSALPTEVWFFRAQQGFDWSGLETYAVVDGVYFQYFTDEYRANGWH